MPADRVVGVLLAAGGATRFGGDKTAARIGDRSLLDHAVAAMGDGGADPVLVVTRPGRRGPVSRPVRWVDNPEWEAGLAASVRAGLAAAVASGATAAVLAPADQPWCGAAVFARLIEFHHQDPAAILVAGYGGEPRNPVVLPRAHWSLADSLVGDQGLSQVVRAAPHRLVECGDLGSVADIDRPGDLPREWS